MFATVIAVLGAALFAVFKKDWGTAKRLLLPVLTAYACIVLGITIFNRLPNDRAKYNLELFWSYRAAVKNRKLIWEIFLNYCMLLPFGLLGSFYLRGRGVIIFGFLSSIAIELAQFFMRRGFFELDDIVGNTIGVIIGVGLYRAIEWLRYSKRRH